MVLLLADNNILSNPIAKYIMIFIAFYLFLMLLLVACYRKVPSGKALVRNGMGGTMVSFSGKVVLPVLHVFEYMDITMKRIVVEMSGSKALICKDDLAADIKMAFFVRINTTPEDMIMVAQALGCERASDVNILSELFIAKFSEAIKSVARRYNYSKIDRSREEFIKEVLQIIGTDLNGFILNETIIDHLEQNSKSKINNIGI